MFKELNSELFAIVCMCNFYKEDSLYGSFCKNQNNASLLLMGLLYLNLLKLKKAF